MSDKKNSAEGTERMAGLDKEYVPAYDKRDRDYMRRFLKKSSPVIELIAAGQIPWGTLASAEIIDSLAATIRYKNEQQKEEDELLELKNDRYSLVNLYAAAGKKPDLPALYSELGNLLRKYGLFDEEVVLLENAAADNHLSDKNLIIVKNRLTNARLYRETDDAVMTDSERIAENLRRALQKKPLNVSEIKALLEQCTDDPVLYEAACSTDKNPDMISIRDKAARLIRSRDYQYALSSHLEHRARTSMILNLYDSLEGDDLFIARTVLTDPNDENKAHMLLYCKDEALLMLGWLYVYGARRICADRLQAIGSCFPEAYQEMDPADRSGCVQEWLAYAADLALDLLSEDEAVRERISDAADVDSEPLHFFLSLHHPRKALRWWHAKKLENQARIAYVGSWTSDDQIKEKLSVKVSNTLLITDMITGDLSGMDLVFGFRKPDDLTLQDRFCVEIMKNHPDFAVREHVRKELLRCNVEIPGVDLTKPDPLYNR